MISERTKAGLAAAKARGTKLGMSARTKKEVRRIAGAGAKANQAAAQARLSGSASLRKAAELLNDRGIESPSGQLMAHARAP